MSTSPINNSSVVLSEPSDHVNNANQLVSSMAMERMRGSMNSSAGSFSSFHEMYGQELGRSGVAMHDGHVKVEAANPLEQNQNQNHQGNNSFLQCRGDNVDLNYGWERYIS